MYIVQFISLYWLYGWLSKLWFVLGYPKYEVAYYNGDPKRHHHFDNHPYPLLHLCTTYIDYVSYVLRVARFTEAAQQGNGSGDCNEAP